MILYSQPLFQFVCLRVNSWFTFSRFAARPNTPIQPILPQSYSLCVLCHLCGVNSIMQNKPNSQNPKIPTTLFLARLYTNIPLCPTRKNKPNQTQSRRDTRYDIRSICKAQLPLDASDGGEENLD